MVEVARGTIVVFADIACPWSHVAVHRLHAARAAAGRDGELVFDMRAFPLELFNERPTPKRTLDAETPVAGALAPEAGWQMWARRDYEYPVTTLLALEAVQAAKEQGLRASEQLDRALRAAFFGASKSISMRHVVLEVAGGCAAVDAAALRDALDDGRARRRVLEQFEKADEAVRGSPHLFLPDGSDHHNPGVRIRWQGAHGRGFPVVESDEPGVYADIIERATNA
jgi:predicted DsbA family dithiol-disulfide isomerase